MSVLRVQNESKDLYQDLYKRFIFIIKVHQKLYADGISL